MRARTVTLKVKFADFQIITRSRSSVAPISDRSHGVSKDRGALLIEDFKRCIAYFNAHPITSPMTAEEASGFHH